MRLNQSNLLYYAMYYIKSLVKVVFLFVLLLLALPQGIANAGYDAAAKDFLVLINSYRVENNLGALAMDAKLQDAANWMSIDMIATCVGKGVSCSHTDSTGRDFSQRLRDFGYPSGITAGAGENLVWGAGNEINAERAFNLWKSSPGHNANMLKSSYAAIGISKSCNGGSCAWVTDFGSKIIQPFNPLPVQASVQNLPDGALIRGNGQIDVYIVKYAGAKKFKRLILSPSVFRNYGHLKWENIRQVDQAALNSFTTSNLVRAEGDQKIYDLKPFGDIGEKQWITTAFVFMRFGFDWDSVYQINQFDRDSYRTGASLG